MNKKKWLGIALLLSSAVVIHFLVGVNYAFMPTIGVSMTPAFMHGDIILIKKGVEDIQIGDVICFKINSTNFKINSTNLIKVVHRVVDIQENPILTFRTKGDANKIIDQCKITADQVIGKVIFVIPAHLLLEPRISFTMVSVLIIVISIGVVYNHFRNTTTKNSKTPVTGHFLFPVLRLDF